MCGSVANRSIERVGVWLAGITSTAARRVKINKKINERGDFSFFFFFAFSSSIIIAGRGWLIPWALAISFGASCHKVMTIMKKKTGLRRPPRYFPFWEIGAVAEGQVWNHGKTQNLDVSVLRDSNRRGQPKETVTPYSVRKENKIPINDLTLV